MKKTTLLFSLLFSVILYAQMNFEKAYFIDNSNNRTECLIKNIDWRNNPTSFEYKTDESSPIKTATIKNVQSFEIFNQAKYVRSNVQIDKSSNNLDHLSRVEAPEFVEEQLFLKELVHGNAILYKYQNGNLVRFFFQKGDSPIQQLVYKMYKNESAKYYYNNEYKQQLKKNLTCGQNADKLERIEYKEKSLTDFFINYNNCVDPAYEQTVFKAKQSSFNINIRPRINFSSLTLKNEPQHLTAEMGSQTDFGIGAELEFVLPFNKNKWAVIAEPTYQYYKAENTQDVNFVVGGKIITTADFKSIEIPFGLRHYMYINQTSKLFINAQYVLDFAMNSSIKTVRSDGSVYAGIDNKVKTYPRYAFGVGYNYNNKLGVELRQLFGKTKFDYWAASYNTTALILSYRIL